MQGGPIQDVRVKHGCRDIELFRLIRLLAGEKSEKSGVMDVLLAPQVVSDKPKKKLVDQVNAMLLNEFLKEHATVQEHGETITRQRKDFEAAIAQQQKQIEALTATMKEQASQIQKVSAQLELSKPAPQTVKNND